ncbi:MAG: phosphatase PAP2 family protein [archaeon]
MAVKKRHSALKKSILAVLVAGAFAGVMYLSFRFDSQFVGFASGLQNPVLNKLMLVVTYYGTIILVLFLLPSLAMLGRKARMIVPLWTGLFFSLISSVSLKLASLRVRPYYFQFPTLKVLVQHNDILSSSFPSLHAAVAFSALPVLNREFPKLRYLWIAFACLVGFSRIYFSLHYLSDVIAGAAIGYLVGFLALKLEEKYSYTKILGIFMKIAGNKNKHGKK